MNCLGMVSRDSGHTRVPAPPHMITGIIFFIETPKKDVSPMTLPLAMRPRKIRQGQRKATRAAPVAIRPTPSQLIVDSRSPSTNAPISANMTTLSLSMGADARGVAQFQRAKIAKPGSAGRQRRQA